MSKITAQQEPYYKAGHFAEYLIIKGLTTATQSGIKGSFKRFAAWTEQENIEPQNATYNEILAYINHLKKSGNKQRSVQVMVSNIKHYYNFLLNEEEINDNPCSNIDIKGVKRITLYETFTPEELQEMYKNYIHAPIPKGMGSKLVHKRNMVILGLVINQAVRTEEIGKLKPDDIKLREGKIFIAGSRRINERELALEAHQVIDLMDYINETKKLLLAIRGTESSNLFISTGESDRFSNVMQNLIQQLAKQNPKLKDPKQLRASVICNWLKVHNLRKVQYLAGHRYVSSTEAYQIHNMDDLKEDISRYHPDL